MSFNDGPANGKTKSNAGLSFPAGRSPVELIKYLLVLLRCNSTASITYLNAPITFRLGPKCKSHFSCCRVFDGVRQKIEAHAMQLMPICNNLSKGRIEMSDKSEAFLRGDLPAKSRRFLKEGICLASLETRPLGVTLEPVDDHTVSVKMSNPALHIDDLPIGKATIDGNAVSLGPGFALQYDATSDTLHCTLPADLVPLYTIEATFHRGHLPPQAARSLGGDPVTPVWTFEAGAPIWAETFDGVATSYGYACSTLAVNPVSNNVAVGCQPFS
jgi:hypothetical protein